MSEEIKVRDTRKRGEKREKERRGKGNYRPEDPGRGYTRIEMILYFFFYEGQRIFEVS